MLEHFVSVVIAFQTRPRLAVSLEPLGVQGQAAAHEGVESVFTGLTDVVLENNRLGENYYTYIKINS